MYVYIYMCSNAVFSGILIVFFYLLCVFVAKSMLVTGYTVSAAHEALLTNPQKIIQQVMKAPDLTNISEVGMSRNRQWL